ncbi:hypothetical protein PtA15_4A549 [Puccinia triticina]|uniref:Uncharacterized protein n=1 Tax=Puccinia triticina TaxID=208348 RepID=A0ABY7CFX1_9BASI|nr:uncharacterized protein PtA15_4A549 [Puccinia triticina]WAQ84098.1 hypothetical protein PtA15_4A549 [Puccinia triticina]
MDSIHSAPKGTNGHSKAPQPFSVTTPTATDSFAAILVPESQEEHGVVSFAQGAPAQLPWFHPFDETT